MATNERGSNLVQFLSPTRRGIVEFCMVGVLLDVSVILLLSCYSNHAMARSRTISSPATRVKVY